MRHQFAYATLLFIGTAFSAGSLSARPLEKQLPPKGTACFERIYDAAHLTAHPNQQVTRITLMQEQSFEANSGEEELLYLSVEVSVRGTDATYTLGGTCTAQGQGLLCEPQWEAGTFSISAGADGSLLITNNDMAFNPSEQAAEERAPDALKLNGDDRAWKLSPGGPQCGKTDVTPTTKVPLPR